MTNRLAAATSPYLLQHRDNPVDWWEWGPDAFAEARRRDVPVLLSIGYAACHWCHVMAHESFEDPETAELMNRLFVNIKVDREERPDVDAVYMESVQAMTGQGGWPMTVFLDHGARPFFAGTYFPPRPRGGMPGFVELLNAIDEAWRNRRDEVSEQAAQMVEAISSGLPPPATPDTALLDTAHARLEELYDPIHGGFGRAPRFPQQPVLELLLRIRTRAPAADVMVTTTLEGMARGGIHDHLGGGFCRYSVDDHWLVPHFEKMLYDNAQLARIYLWAGVELGRSEFVAVARSTLAYMDRDLRHDLGGFFSSEDADSEGVEGKFYIWSLEELREVAGDGPVVDYFGVTPEGNFEGANILTVREGDLHAFGEERRRLLERRATRVRPGLDDKVVTAWNGLAIRAFAEAGAALDDDRLVETARAAAAFLTEHLVVDGRLMRSWRDGRTSVPGFLDDHTAAALGLLAVFSATGEEVWYSRAIGLIDELARFRRPEGGFHTTPDDGEALVKRPFDVTDNPTPSGNALAAEALLLAGLLTGNGEWREEAEGCLSAAGALMPRYPTMVAHHLSVLDATTKTKELAIVGPGWRALAKVANARFRPHVVVAPSATPTSGVPLLAGRAPDSGTLAYVCRDFACELPTSDPTLLATLLDA
ncbi:MAG: thioredoxin domain-containing protein [Actinobacteria bacterium]|nr:thioredoxin domain-containing protein [Actinomycetota bacterium]